MKLRDMKSFLIVGSLLVAGICFMSMTTLHVQDWVVPAKYKTMQNPEAGKQDKSGIGKELYNTHCASCHGKEGLGDGKKAGNLDTELRDMTSEEVQAQTDGELYYKSFIGRDEMPNFESKIKDSKDKWMLVNYLRKLAE